MKGVALVSPYSVEKVGEGRIVVCFARICDHLRTPEHDSELNRLVELNQAVAADLSRTEMIHSAWLRLLARLSAKAKDKAKVFAVVNMKGTLRKSTDAIGLADEFVFAKDIDEVWRL